MSNPNIAELQIALGLTADGVRGPITNAAILAAADAGRLAVGEAGRASADSTAPLPTIPKGKLPDAAADIPAAGEAKLGFVHADLQDVIRAASAQCDVPFTVIEGLRSIERQKKLFAQRASKTMRSRHLTGHAVDLWPLDDNGKALRSGAAFPKRSQEARDADERLWARLRVIAANVKQIAAERGVALEWGGDWASFPDGPHFQLSWGRYPA